MRIIAGTARGVQLVSPKGKEVRPTLDRVRESVFSIIAPRIDEGSRFLDLFAGTGANGLEALSRGAAETVFVDFASESLRLINENLSRIGLQERTKVLRGTLPQDLPSIAKSFGTFDIIYADPPYRFTEHNEFIAGLHESGLLAADGLLVLEHHKKASINFAATGLQRTKERVYGNTAVSFLSVEPA